MTATFVISALLTMAQTPATTVATNGEIEQREVAYEELTTGRPAQAIAALEASLREEPGDPAILINLGTAYTFAGDTERAALSFRAAMTSDTRYRLELADGTWVDSRTAARRALESLERTRALAALAE